MNSGFGDLCARKSMDSRLFENDAVSATVDVFRLRVVR